MIIDGAERPTELMELSYGCPKTGNTVCILLRLTDTGEIMHYPGGPPEVAEHGRVLIEQPS